ncbi:hypothetical protein CNMCM5793_009658 [Aspergillus hiratsukae]|uniref:Uncharacterized protein n=1 Tax=Aspergillus hiratsukae TaxID=1194566 RepID=A0A8H6PK44_9EURO|nr:hypothetical protein CNMCM5793_009658 [Aspergillus hiratsukae]KAF7156196.1 hypothetical protein CNMCM6106_009261 [Aspergillus hiratsukae]
MASRLFFDPMKLLRLAPLVTTTSSLMYAWDEYWFLSGFLRPEYKHHSEAMLPRYFRRFFEQGIWIIASLNTLTLSSSVANLLIDRLALDRLGSSRWYCAGLGFTVCHFLFVPLIAYPIRDIMEDRSKGQSTKDLKRWIDIHRILDQGVDHSRALEKDGPMKGAGFYNAHSALQAAAMQRALPLFDTIPVNTASERFTVVQYGCAQGANSILPFKHILKARFSAEEAKTQEAHLILSDRLGNDFNTLVQTINRIEWLPELPKRHSIFTSMAANSFYDRVVPGNTVHVGFSLATLHHLERSPSHTRGSNNADGNTTQELNRQQAHEDLIRLLTLRAQEFRQGGALILSLVSQSSSGAPNCRNLVDACQQAMIQMVMDGRISPEVAGAFHVPTYDRTIEDVRRSLAHVQPLWTTEELFEAEITHPAYERLQKALAKARGVESEIKMASRSYADTVVDWMMAVIAGYFAKALQVAAPVLDEDARAGLLMEWSKRTKEVFLQEHRDSRVSCWFIFVKLLRI